MVKSFKQVFITLLSFDKSLLTKFVSLNNQPCMLRPTLVDINSKEPLYYPFAVKCDRCCDTIDHPYALK